ncbi:MAG: translational activator for mitochondrial COX1 [Candelina submexicana]|nr:MAG: translational activator for mitochondrial COX1 [Candelina submexicana]
MASQDYAQRFGQLVLRTNFRAIVQTSAHGPISICQRGISANDTPFRKAFPERNTKAFASHPRRSFAKQAYTFLESYGQVPKNEPTQLPSPAGLASTNPPDVTGRVLLQPNNLFHPFSRSPSQAIRRRAAFIKQHAYCPHPNHQPTRLPFAPDDPEARKSSVKLNSAPPSLVDFECPDCGIPVYCSEDHWADDYESHLEICDTLRQINEDDHDLRSGRFFPEFEYPDMQMEEALVNMTNWDTLLYTREFTAIDADRSMRQATRLLTYPVTIGSVLHELSPYNIRSGGRLTTEGLKSLSGESKSLKPRNSSLVNVSEALRYTLHPPRTGAGMDIKGIRPKPPPVRIFILGARAESSLPREVWVQLPFMFPPRAAFHLIFIGPESMVNRDHEFPLPERTPTNPFGAVVEGRINHQLKISTFVEYYHTLHKAGHFAPYDPYFDCFVLFHPGLGHPASSHEWEETLPQLLETKVPILITGYTQWDMQRDLKWVEEKMAGEVDVLMEPGENRFRSLRWDLNDLDPQDISCGNWGIWAFRGKRYLLYLAERVWSFVKY